MAVPDVEELFLETLLTLEWVRRRRRPGTGAARPHRYAADPPRRYAPAGRPRTRGCRGEGEAGAGGLARAVGGPGGHVESLSIEPAAARKGSHEVAGYVVTAVNARTGGSAPQAA